MNIMKRVLNLIPHKSSDHAKGENDQRPVIFVRPDEESHRKAVETVLIENQEVIAALRDR